MTLFPAPGYILIEPLDDAKRTASGLEIPEEAGEKPAKGKVLAVGENYEEHQTEVFTQVTVGQTVVFRRYGAGQDLREDGKELKLIHFKDVMGYYE